MHKYRNTENGRYFCISNPKPINEHTHNFCVPRQALKWPVKDFLFEWTNPGVYSKIRTPASMSSL